MTILLLWVALIGVLISVGVFLFFSLWTVIALILTKGVPYVPLNSYKLKLLNENIKLQPLDKVIDLGCGDGRVLRLFEKQGVKDLTGYELNLSAFVQAQIKNKILKSQTKIFLKNFNSINLGNYNIVFCYLLAEYLLFLRKKFDQELKPGTKIISFAFEIKDWRKPSQIIITDKNNPEINRIFIYEI